MCGLALPSHFRSSYPTRHLPIRRSPATTGVPKCVDGGKPPPYKTHRHARCGLQEGTWAGYKYAFPFRNLTVDHMTEH